MKNLPMRDLRVWRSQFLVGFTLVELLTVIAIIGILASIIIPTVATVRKSATKTQCSSNLRQVAVAYLMYGNDNKGFIPKALNPQDPDGYSPNDINRGTSLYLGADVAYRHSQVEISPLALRKDTFVTRFRDTGKPGFFRTVSYWLIASIWKNTLRFEEPYSDRSPPRALSPSRAAMLGVVNPTYAAGNGSNFDANIYLWDWGSTQRVEFYDSDGTFLAFFDGHVSAVKKANYPATANPPNN